MMGCLLKCAGLKALMETVRAPFLQFVKLQ
jgi:hypothetical protein